LHLKCHELSAQLFEPEQDLAIALMEAIDEPSQWRGYPLSGLSLASYLGILRKRILTE